MILTVIINVEALLVIELIAAVVLYFTGFELPQIETFCIVSGVFAAFISAIFGGCFLLAEGIGLVCVGVLRAAGWLPKR